MAPALRLHVDERGAGEASRIRAMLVSALEHGGTPGSEHAVDALLAATDLSAMITETLESAPTLELAREERDAIVRAVDARAAEREPTQPSRSARAAIHVVADVAAVAAIIGPIVYSVLA